VAQVIRTNVDSLIAQRNLNQTNKGLSQTLQRLSTGFRINSAKDDAAGLAISERFTAQIKGLNQAMRNANDGISFTQTAEGALSTIGGNLQRIRELAVQSSSGSNTAGDRQALNGEVQALIADVQRIALNTEFNGQSILNGTISESFMQVGAQQGQMISVNGVDSRTSELGSQEMVAGGAYTADQVAAIAEGGQVGSIEIVVTPYTSGGTSIDTFSVTSAGSASSLEEAVANINKDIQSVIDEGRTNGQSQMLAESGMRAFLRVDNDGNTSIAVVGNFSYAESGGTAGQSEFRFAQSGGAITTSDGAAAAGITSADFGTTMAVNGLGCSANVELADLDVLTRESSTQAIGIIDGALNKVNSLRAEIGAVQVRFETAITNLNVGSNNMDAARSRIRDTDFAAETAQLTKLQILQQAGISVLSQANQAPQSVLSLLG
jgi:flagellin